MNSKILNSYFLFLFSFIPASIIIGPAVSLINILLIDFSFIFLIFYKKDFKFLSNKTVKLIIFLCLYNIKKINEKSISRILINETAGPIIIDAGIKENKKRK